MSRVGASDLPNVDLKVDDPRAAYFNNKIEVEKKDLRKENWSHG